MNLAQRAIRTAARFAANPLRSVRGMWESAKQRIGTSRIVAAFRDAWRDYSRSTREHLQKRARYWICNSTLLSRLADIFEGGTVGTGLVVNPDSTDREWNKAARESFSIWSKFADVSSRQSFECLQGLVARSWYIDGECFVVKAKGRDKQGTERPRLQILEAHRVATPPGRTKDEGVTIIDGVEIDGNPRSPTYMRPVAYHVSREIGNGKTEWTRLLSEDVIHVFEPERPGQYRGIPFCASSLNTLEDLERLGRLEMKAATAAAVIAWVRTTKSGEIDPDELLATGGSIDTSSSGAVSGSKEFTGGETVILGDGEDMKQLGGARPSVVTMEYLRSLKGDVCMGNGIPLCIADPASMQGTVYRGALAVFDRWIKARSSVMQAFCAEVFIWVMSESMRVEVAISDPPADGSWVRVKIYAPKSLSVDLGYDSAATLADIGAGLKSYSQVYGEQGLHWEDAFESIAQQRQRGKELGVLAGATGSDVQTQALNGAQLKSVQEVIASVSAGQMAPDSAKRLLYIALPTTDRAEIDAMVDAAATFVPRAPEPASIPQPSEEPATA